MRNQLAISAAGFTVFSLLIVCFISIAGCESTKSPSVVNTNIATLKTEGEKIGTLPDGRSIYRYEIKRGSMDSSHWIYVVGDGSSVTNNHHQGKTNSVEVLINGKEYIEKLAERPEKP